MLLTAFSQRDLIEEARDAGVSAYLVKPFQARELLPAVADVLARARQEWAIAAEESKEPVVGAEDKIATRRVVDQAKAALMDGERHVRERRVHLHPADGHAEPRPHARCGAADRRRHADPVSAADHAGTDRPSS